MKNVNLLNVSEIEKYLFSVEPLSLTSLQSDETVLVVVDMINGFVHSGALASPRIKNIISEVSALIEKSHSKNIDIIAFADSHSENAVEFKSFPVHCLENHAESQIIDEIKNIAPMTVIPKNSTNGFHAPVFREMLEKNPHWKNFIVCGDCTDICVLNFCLTLKTYMNQNDTESRVIVPLNAVETYDDGGISHSADFANLSAFMIMKTNGIELVKEID